MKIKYILTERYGLDCHISFSVMKAVRAQVSLGAYKHYIYIGTILSSLIETFGIQAFTTQSGLKIAGAV